MIESVAALEQIRAIEKELGVNEVEKLPDGEYRLGLDRAEAKRRDANTQPSLMFVWRVKSEAEESRVHTHFINWYGNTKDKGPAESAAATKAARGMFMGTIRQLAEAAGYAPDGVIEAVRALPSDRVDYDLVEELLGKIGAAFTQAKPIVYARLTTGKPKTEGKAGFQNTKYLAETDVVDVGVLPQTIKL